MKATIGLLPALLVGCASQVGLTVHSEPVGAYITEAGNGTPFGIAPARVVYQKAELKRYTGPDGCYRTRGLTARWVSGAQTSLDFVRLCPAVGDEQVVTIRRDPGVPGLDRDLEFAVRVQQLWAAQEQARAADEAASAGSTAAAAALVTAIQASKPTTCTTRQVGESLRTTCN